MGIQKERTEIFGILYKCRQFQDRDFHRSKYRDLIKLCKINDSGDASYVINYYGIGGRGKSRLLEQLSDEVVHKETNPIVLFIDLKSIDTDMVSILLSMKECLQNQCAGMVFPCFELALYTLYRKSGFTYQETKKTSFLDKIPLVKACIEMTGAYHDAVDAATALINYLEHLSDKARELINRKKTTLFGIETMDMDTIRKNLPIFFASDINSKFENTDTQIHIFIDTYERLAKVSEGNGMDVGSGEKWLNGRRGLIRNLRNTVWAIAGREKLTWCDFDSYWEKWLKNNTFRLDGFDEENSNGFLSACGLPDNLYRGLYKLTWGDPLYLNICVDQYEEICLLGKTPTIGDFGNDIDELLRKYTYYISEEMRDAVYVAAGMRVWNKNVIYTATKAIGIQLQPFQYEKINTLSYVTILGMHKMRAYSMQQQVSDILSTRLNNETRSAVLEAILGLQSSNDEERHIILLAACNIAGKVIETVALADALDEEADALRESIQLNSAIDFRERAYHIRKQILGEFDQSTLKTLYCLAIDYCLSGNAAKATELASKAYYWQKRVLGAENADTLKSLKNLAICYLERGDYKTAKTLLHEVFVVYSDKFGFENDETLSVVSNLVACDAELGISQITLMLQQEIYGARKQMHGIHDKRTISALRDLAVTYGRLGAYRRAKEYAYLAYKDSIEAFGENAPETIKSMDCLAEAYIGFEDYENAEKYSRITYSFWRERLGDSHPDTLDSLENLAICYGFNGNCGTSIILMQQVYDERSRRQGLKHPATIKAQENLSVCYGLNGKYKQATVLAQSAYETYKEILGEKHGKTQDALSLLASCCVHLGYIKKSKKCLYKLYNERLKILGADHPATMETLSKLTVLYGVLYSEHDRGTLKLIVAQRRARDKC